MPNKRSRLPYTITPQGIRISIHTPMREIERIYIQIMLERHGGDIDKVSGILGISVGRLKGRIKNNERKPP